MIVFLSETKAYEDRMQVIAKKIGFQNLVAIGPKGRAGGLCMLWVNDLEVEILEFNSNMIAIQIKECNVCWSLVGFYGPPYKAKHLKTWINLCALLETIQGPWMCCWDFNVLIDDTEKVRGVCGSSSTPGYLKELMFDLAAMDLGFVGNKFTWSNHRWGRNSIREWLDSGIANIYLRLAFPKATVLHLGGVNSDHCPLLIDTNPDDSFSPRPFRFEAVWAKDPRCYEVINLAWNKNFVGSAGVRTTTL
uniref:Endonuclease/exonuclease/phosphatase domain-containing protein n=1 Tax=Fagus sylvatica TaxID=28930 RepID=A0A2N9I7H8_FAGSY